MNKLLLLLICILIVGCAPTKPRWSKDSVSQQQANRDYNECEMYGRAHSNMNPFMAIDLIDRCMLQKGYK